MNFQDLPRTTTRAQFKGMHERARYIRRWEQEGGYEEVSARKWCIHFGVVYAYVWENQARGLTWMIARLPF